MTNIPTWHERAMAHPDHQSGMISEDMIRARMCEEIADLRAEVEKLTRERDEARAALKPFSELYLWPDDAGEWTANDVRSDEDWDEERNDAKTDDVFITRGQIRAARKALEAKP